MAGRPGRWTCAGAGAGARGWRGAMATALTKAGIPVFTVNVSVALDDLKAQGGQIMQYVGPDQVEGGRVMGEATLAALGKTTKIVAGIVGDPQQLPTNQRDGGF